MSVLLIASAVAVLLFVVWMADVGTGATITFGTSGFTGEFISFSWSDIERPSIDTTHLSTTVARTHIPGDLYDSGSVTAEIAFDPDDFPPISSAAETVTITCPIPAGLSNGATWAASAFVTSFSFEIPLEEKMTASMGIKFSGAITQVDAT